MGERGSPEHQSFINEITYGPNAKMYGELIPHLNKFGHSNWAWGVNFFFVGGSVIDQDMMWIYVKGDPHVHSYTSPKEGYKFWGLNEIRAHELEMGRMKLPKKWDDLKVIADMRRAQVREELQPYYERFSAIDPGDREAMRQTLEDGIRGKNFRARFRAIKPKILETALIIYIREKQLRALSESLEIIDELLTAGAVKEDFSREPIVSLIDTYEFHHL